MESQINELAVLQIIYTILLVQNNASNVNEYKVSLVKLTNEFQNNILINQIVNHDMKLDINDILAIIKRIFPNQRISLIDGQLSFHNLSLRELVADISTRVNRFIKEQTEVVRRLEVEILEPSTTRAIQSPPPAQPQPQSQQSHQQRSVATVDPKKAKLLELYRDTVLNKLQNKSNQSNNKNLEWLYDTLSRNKDMATIVRDIIKIDSLRNDTPTSVHELQLTLQKSICDGLMCSYTGDNTWKSARQLQADFDDTVQFMRRALE
ncbi:hypothetical protein HG535_0B03820 [Zygotorulaspora mrakii]|uniref:Chromatin modification-related protein EAF5 n=1 Tax=Zygotorulaspora mrakii TaxID=42260 RepID=A0A7H9B0N1_ZYGMR|nr:uncharacterized protein HG535_0B03820 [Zygotorulaspora mrakii]QLG71342.1 hypothetical protein HG535_0B03820 [Zygotorulaspora mrakii]